MHDGRSGLTPGGRRGFVVAATLGIVIAAACGRTRGEERATPTAAEARVAAVRQAAADYARAFNERDFAALGAQWTDNAELVEGEGRIVGRAGIVRSLEAWLARNPQAKMEIEVGGIAFPADTVARVAGRMTFTSKPGAKPVVSRFASLRVLEGGQWRLAESLVQPSQAAVLDELEWLVGTWKSDPGRGGDEVEATFSRSLGDACIVGRTTIRPKSGGEREVLQVIHADRATGLVRTWIFDSSGARAEGIVEADGPSYHQTLVGTPAESAGGDVARWVQVIAPTGEGRFTLHAIERTLDGRPLPDGAPMDFRKVR